MEIRPFRAEDEPQVLEVLRYGIKDQERYAWAVDPQRDEASFFDLAWQDQTQSLKDEPEHWWVAVEDAKVIGVLRMAFWTEEPLGPLASVVELDVHPAARNQGIGGQLLAHAEAVARSADAVMFFIGGFAANPAMRLYRRAGFVESPESLRYNEGPDHLVLGKRLKAT